MADEQKKSTGYHGGSVDTVISVEAVTAEAAAIAQPGDTITIRGGLYREWVNPASGGEATTPITYQGAPGETAVISGSGMSELSWSIALRIARGALTRNFPPIRTSYRSTRR